jgi:hypothetical protein
VVYVYAHTPGSGYGSVHEILSGFSTLHIFCIFYVCRMCMCAHSFMLICVKVCIRVGDYGCIHVYIRMRVCLHVFEYV